MIFPQSKLYVCDNSGVSKVRCIKVLNKRRSTSFGVVGDFFIGVVISIRGGVFSKKRSIKKNSLVICQIIGSKSPSRFNIFGTGFSYKFVAGNFALVFKKDSNKVKVFNPVFNRVEAPLPFLMKQKGFLKSYSLSIRKF